MRVSSKTVVETTPSSTSVSSVREDDTLGVTLHPLEGNVVSRDPIYDDTYRPAKIIGYETTSYEYDFDNIHIDPAELVLPNDPVSIADTSLSVGKGILKRSGIAEQWIALGLTPLVPEFGFIYDVFKLVSNISSLNDALTIDAHLRTYKSYFSDSPFQFPPLYDFHQKIP